MNYEAETTYLSEGRSFYFPNRAFWKLEIACYTNRRETDHRSESDGAFDVRPVVFANTGQGGRRHGAPPYPDAHYIHAPPEGIRHAAATGDPTQLLDWLLENACADRPWLEAAINVALGCA